MVLGRSGELRRALPETELAAQHLDALAPRDQVVLLLNQGTILMFLGRLERAAETLNRATRRAQQASLAREAFMSRSNEGYVRYLTGDFPRALALLAEAEAEATGADSVVVRVDRGRVLMEAGLLSEAQRVLVQAAELCRTHRQGHLLGEIELELARVSGLLGRLDEGRAWARRARDRFRRRGESGWAARAQVVLGQLAIAGPGRPRRLLAEGESVLTQLRSGDPVLLSEHRLVLAEVAFRAGDREQASRYLQEVGSSRVRLPLRGRLHVAHLRARLAIDAGDPTRARKVLDAASVVMSREQAGVSSADLRSALAMHGVPSARLHIALEVERGARAVFECTERWRAATAQIPTVLPPVDEELACDLTRLREVREQLRQVDQPEARQGLRRQEEQLQAAIRARSWALNGASGPARERGGLLPRVRRLLSQHEADLVSFVPIRSSMLAVTVVDGRTTMVEVPGAARLAELGRRIRADLEAAGRLQLGVFRDAVWASLMAGMAELDAELLEPLGLGARRVVIVPAQSLVAMPWALAPSLAGVPFVVSPSAREWAARAGLTPTLQDRDPVVTAVAGPGLALADQEVARVGDCWPGATRHGSGEARMEHLRDALTSADVVHVAAHGTHHQQNPMFASVHLAGGPLYVYDLEHTGVAARHVVLSSCEVGMAEVRSGDEPIGLAAGLLRLGAASVVAGTCRVPDELSAQVMIAYHRALSGGLAADRALAQVLSEVDDPLAAAFQVFGAAWQPPLRRPRPSSEPGSSG